VTANLRKRPLVLTLIRFSDILFRGLPHANFRKLPDKNGLGVN